MPLHDFICTDCAHQFEEFFRPGEPVPNKTTCAHCDTNTAERLPSAHGGYAIRGNNSASVTPKGSKSFKRSTS